MEGKVFVIGLGLIGGSLAMAIRHNHDHEHAQIVGYDVNTKNIELAKFLGIIDHKVDTIEEGALDADLIILAVPVDQTEKIIVLLADMELKSNVIITDAGSTKGTVVRAAERLEERGITFIGGHPMAGSHKSGAAAAKPLLFENAFYLLTPSENSKPEVVEQLKEWLKGTRANFIVVSPQTHDWLTGVISHFPHIVAAGLVTQAKNYSQENKLVTRLAAGGFRDITRIASSSPEMWRDILLHNRDILLNLLDDWLKEMTTIKEWVSSRNSEEIYRFFSEAKTFRDEMPVSSKGAIPAFYDLYVDIPDTPGSIAEITSILAKEEISITNIRIIETREEIYGILVISFQNDEDRLKAADAIKKYTSFETILT